jgi:hypothetical protein
VGTPILQKARETGPLFFALATDGNAAFAGVYAPLTPGGVEASSRPEEPAAMTQNALADELVSQLPIHRDTRWTAGSLGLDAAAFDALAQRLLELETLGAIDVMNLSRDAHHGLRRLNAIRFMRLA